MIKMQIGTIQKTFSPFITDAPVNYDGFGTFTLRTIGKKRLVLIEDIHQTWQINRYFSGRHTAESVNYPNMVNDLSEKLYKKLFVSPEEAKNV